MTELIATSDFSLHIFFHLCLFQLKCFFMPEAVKITEKNLKKQKQITPRRLERQEGLIYALIAFIGVFIYLW